MSFTFADIKKWALARLSPAQKTAGATWAVAHTPGGDLIGKDGETLGGGGSFPSITDDGTTVAIAPTNDAAATVSFSTQVDTDLGAGFFNRTSVVSLPGSVTLNATTRDGSGDAQSAITAQAGTFDLFSVSPAGELSELLIQTTSSSLTVDDAGGNVTSLAMTPAHALTTATDGASISTVTVTPTTYTVVSSQIALLSGAVMFAGTIDGVTSFQMDASSMSFSNSSGGGAPMAFFMSNLPTSDPGVANQVWNDGGVVMISAG